MRNPNIDATIDRIRRLDGKNISVVDIQASSGLMQIVGSEYGRVRVEYTYPSEGRYRTGFLVDDAVQNTNNSFDIAVRYANGEVDIIPVQETVPLELAVSTARYFMEHDAVPPSSKWTGTVIVPTE